MQREPQAGVEPLRGRSTAMMDIPPEPIAIIGIGCRFPGGADSPAKFWNLLIAGRDGIVDVPEDRWDISKFYSSVPGKPAKMYVRKGGFLREPVDRFDPLFFGISPREAVYMDPQQRLLLEVAWEAVEDAGLVPAQLSGSNIGVYIGGFTLDSMILQYSPLNREILNSHHAATATSMTMLANRISYTFDLRGPSIAIDTACSSSLVALHYACQGLWRGECSLALAGGVNVMLCPEFPIVMCQGHFLAPDGYCKSFDERADGYGRGEGCGIVVLKPLATALEDGDEIYAIVRGTGINQDGRTEGITVPNALAQEALIRNVYSQAKIGLRQVRYVEAHGTGTPVGDPIEAAVLGKTVGAGRTEDNACVVASVKANIGHLEAAAGIAGVIKACLCIKHRQIPPQIHLREPNPKIPFAEWGLRLPRSLEPMPGGEGPVCVGVNSFGYGGTNAHAVLQQAPERESRREAGGEMPRRPHVLPISARSEGALEALVRSYLCWLSSPGSPDVRDLCFSAGVRRAHFEHRLAVTAETISGVIEQLQAYLDRGRAECVTTGRWVPGKEPKPVFVFSGMGPQWWGMGRELLREVPSFRAEAEACDEPFRHVSGWSILEEMTAAEGRSRMREPQVAQPANFVLQVALAALWRDWGIEPAAHVGHSVGEVAAAYLAGALDREDAVRVIYHRSRLQQDASGAGRMLAVGLSVAAALALLAGREGRVSLAAVNSPSAVTLSGDSDALEELAAELEGRHVFNRFLHVDVAYHSDQMERLKGELEESLRGLCPRSPSIPLYSTVTGQLVRGESLGAEYWCRNMRASVLFADAMNSLIDGGYTHFLELGPHPVLSASIDECLKRRGIHGEVFASLRRGEPESAHLLQALGGLYTTGYPVDWRHCSRDRGEYVRLPSYPWQRERYWSESEAAAADRLGNVVHPLLGTPVSLALATWESDLNPNYLPYLVDHVIEGVTVLPAAAYVEAGLAIHALMEGSEPAVLEDLEFTRALVLEPTRDYQLQWSYDEKTREYRVHSRSREQGRRWTLHAAARISPVSPCPRERADLHAIMARCGERIEANDFYARLRGHGLHYGTSFLGVRGLWRRPREVLARLEMAQGEGMEDVGYHLHPALLDASFQSLFATLDVGEDAARGVAHVPVRIQRVGYMSRPGTSCWCHATLTNRSTGVIEGNILLYDDWGDVLVEVHGLRCAALAAAKGDDTERLNQWTYALTWEKTPPVAAFANPARWLLFMDEGGVGTALTEQLYAQGASQVIQVVRGSAYHCEMPTHFQVRRNNRGDLEDVIRQVDMGNCHGVVYLWGLDLPGDTSDPVGMKGAIDCLHLIQALAEAIGPKSPRLYIITQGVQQVHPEEPMTGLAQAPLVGLGRVAAWEHPDLGCKLVDLEPVGDGRVGSRLATEVLADNEEDDVAFRGRERYVHRLVRVTLKQLEDIAANRRPLSSGDGDAFRLEVGKPGSTDHLRFREIARREPGPGEVEVKIHAAALNFKDVLKVLELLPEKAVENTFHGSGLGMEAAGVITRVGDGVQGYRAGDAIVASLRGSFSTHVTVTADCLFAVPQLDHLSLEEAASIPVAFMTAYYALHEVARLSAGETVLIHSATGGVGLAAIQVARWLGAEIFATAGSPEKRDFLRRLGVERIWDSRSLEFAEGILSSTSGHGVDVVLNSLPGEAFRKSLSVVSSSGRFIEIGKRDIVENSLLPMLHFNRNLSFTAIDLDRMMVDRPELIRRTLREVWRRLEAGDFTPPPVTVYPASRVSEAFRCMARSKQIGKIVIDMVDVGGVSLLPKAGTGGAFRADATYLVTGGFGGFGLEIARWLARRGARHLVLVGRRGPAQPRARQVVEELTSQGVSVMAVAADVSEESQVAQLLADIAGTMPALRGVFHAAAVLDDGLLAYLDGARLAKVMAPKALGAWILHQLTRSLPLDNFVVFSSATALMGNLGQGNYVAANAFLDALARRRRAEGLPATSINWGALADIGMVAEDERAAEHLSCIGIRGLPIASVMDALARILEWNPVQVALMEVDWARWGQFHARAKTSPRFSHVLAESAGEGQGLATGDLRATLMAMGPEEQVERIASRMAELVAETLRMPTDKVDVYQPLTEMGIDSLVGMELQTAVSVNLGIEVSILELMRGDNIVGVAGVLLERMRIPVIVSSPDEATVATVLGEFSAQSVG